MSDKYSRTVTSEPVNTSLEQNVPAREPASRKRGMRMASRNDYQSCPKCGTRWYANETLPCPSCPTLERESPWGDDPSGNFSKDKTKAMNNLKTPTPGPWKIVHDADGDFAIYAESGKLIAITEGDSPEDEANARLIASAAVRLFPR